MGVQQYPPKELELASIYQNTTTNLKKDSWGKKANKKLTLFGLCTKATDWLSYHDKTTRHKSVKKHSQPAGVQWLSGRLVVSAHLKV